MSAALLAPLTSDFVFASLALKYPHDGDGARGRATPVAVDDEEEGGPCARPACGTRRKVPRPQSPIDAARTALLARVAPTEEGEDLRDVTAVPAVLLPYAARDAAPDVVRYRGEVVARVASSAVAALVHEVLRATPPLHAAPRTTASFVRALCADAALAEEWVRCFGTL